MKLLFFTPACDCEQSLLMDRAYEGDNMRATAKELGYTPVVPPKKNRIDPWEYDEELYKSGLIEKIFHELGEDADLQDISIDSTYIKAHKASAGAERGGPRNPPMP